MIGGLAGRALSTQGGFMGNSGGLAGQYPLGLVGQIGGINEQLSPQEGGNPLGIGGLVGQMLPPIDPASHRNQMRQKKIYDKGRGTDNPNEGAAFLRRTGAQLPPLADGFGGMFAGPQQGQAGSMLGMGLVGQLTGANQAGNNQGLFAMGGQPVTSKFDPMTIKSVY